MITLYHTPISFNSRRVWVALLEKELDFQLIPLKLDGDQFSAEFLALNPFHHIPILVDGSFSLFESLAILDYLEAQYPDPALLPSQPQALGKIKCLMLATVNELLPAVQPLIRQAMGFGAVEEAQLTTAQQKTDVFLKFLGNNLESSEFLASDHLTLADIVAGTVIPLLPSFGIPLDPHPAVQNWISRLNDRPSWQQTQPKPEEIKAFKARMKKLMAK
jgi:glutathione S-transferase